MNLRLHGDTLAPAAALDFAVNVWPGQRPPALEQALERAGKESRYPQEREAREAIAAQHGRLVSEVLLLNGACEAFWLLAHTLRPRHAACVHPSFTEPEAALRAVGTAVTQVFRSSDSWRLDGNAVPKDATFVVLGNPNNPTGSLDAADAITDLLRSERLVVVDESFIDFTDGACSLAGTPLPGLVVVRSLTKLWSLAGVRAGYLLAASELVASLEANRQPWSVNALACAALAHCARDTDTPARVAADVAREREHLRAGLALLGLEVWPSAANFFLVKTHEAAAVHRQLLEAGIAVRPASSFPGLDSDYIRVAVRERADNERLLAALGRALS
jgi:histidinol-phosphate/aromatic aminotransferase/cobyric acid decarboxylase-like protein